jgi:hypothetical protein
MGAQGSSALAERDDVVVAPPLRRHSGSDKRQRTAQYLLRLHPSEREKIETDAAEHGFTGTGAVQQYLRQLLGLD